ncbi:hypothetical protein [Rhizobium sp. CC-YZS058]|nr:hypothetical protein [Rhizobium sp. CC-YZS058]MEA3535508.1 hypothetical protein [Rhizobium sp. CC-YZS058]
MTFQLFMIAVLRAILPRAAADGFVDVYRPCSRRNAGQGGF